LSIRREDARFCVGILAIEPMRLAGLASAFEGHTKICTVSGEVEALLRDLSIECLILDFADSSVRLEMQLLVKRIRPDIRQLVMGPMGGDEAILRAIMAGAHGYVDASAGPYAVRLATESVLSGCIWAPRKLLSMLIERLLQLQGPTMALTVPTLSPRERQVLDLIMQARSNREIATELQIEERTVKAYVANLLRKTGAENRVSLSVQATQQSMRGNRSTTSSAASPVS
jgi:DNA-binding NarL/FixJ family response regulator